MPRRSGMSPPLRVLGVTLAGSLVLALVAGVGFTVEDGGVRFELPATPAPVMPTIPAVAAFVGPTDEPGAVASLPTPAGSPSTAPAASGRPAPTPTPIPVPTTRIATRVAVADLGIDLPVMLQPTSYPPCRVAMYLTAFRQPGQGWVTYLYGHAQAGSFLPLLNASLVNGGAAMVGMTVRVWTGDSLVFTYRISAVHPHQQDLSIPSASKGESAWLQTSESRGAGTPKLMVAATFVSSASSDFASAHPVPRPVAC